MQDKRKSLQTYIFSTVGVIGIFVLAIFVNIIADALNLRGDFTEEGLYTLSSGTKAVLARMDTPVTIRFYYSKDAAQMPVYLKAYAGRVEDLLTEYRVNAGENIVIQKHNPTPDSDAEDSANMDGIRGQPLGNGESIYLGLAVSCLDETVALPFLSPERENLLEYDVTRAIYRVQHPEKPVLGVMSSLPVMGREVNPMMRMQGMGGEEQPAWVAISELKRDFEVREVQKDTESIDEDIDVLMLVHATELADKTLFAIDQFVLRGGKLLAFLDPMSMIEAQQQDPMRRMQNMPPSASTLGPLLDAWGIEFDTEKVVADLLYMTRVQGRDGQPQSMPTVLSLDTHAMDEDDPATSDLDSLLFAFGGVFRGDGAAGLRREVLIRTSEDIQGVEKFMAQMPGEAIVKDFKSEGRAQALALRLTGTFKTAFPEGKPGAEPTAEPDAGADQKEETNEADTDTTPGAAHLRESASPGAVVLVGDSDMIYDHFCVRRQNFFGQDIISPMNDNLTLLQNLAEQLSGDSNLISIRSRGRISRPFVVVRRMQAEAEQKYQDQIKALEDEVAEAQRKINELQREKSKDQRFILSKEQQDAIAKFRQKEAETKQELKAVRKKFRRDIDSLENRIKWANIALMPVLVSLSGIVLAMVKRRRMARR